MCADKDLHVNCVIHPSGAGSSELGLRTTIAITATRLIVIPMGGMAIVTFADKLGFLPPDDKMFRFVLLLQHTMPSSILAGLQDPPYAQNHLSWKMFYCYCFGEVKWTDFWYASWKS